jgi:hypothetical protein
MNSEHILPLLGAGAFGVLIGWFVYYINRYRKGDVQFSDITTLIGVIGGASAMALFQSTIPGLSKEHMFGAYGIGLFLGFFGYFVLLLVLVKNSGGAFNWTWFLDGRRKNPKTEEGEGYPGGAPPPENRPMLVRMAAVEDRLGQLLPPNAGAQPPVYPFRVEEEGRDGGSGPQLVESVNSTAARIITICETNWESNKSDCNAFVKAVAGALGVTGLDGDADQITGTITGPGWRQLADGVEAKQAADAGEFVVGGLRGSEHNPARAHGHVVVVVTGGLANKKYPTAYWGSLGGIGRKNSTVNYSWREGDRDKVHYAAKTIA